MNTEMFKVFIASSIALLIIGLILIFSSVSIGMGMAESWIQSYYTKYFNESIDTEVLNLRRAMYIQQVMITGSILFLTGLGATFTILFKRFTNDKRTELNE